MNDTNYIWHFKNVSELELKAHIGCTKVLKMFRVFLTFIGSNFNFQPNVVRGKGIIQSCAK